MEMAKKWRTQAQRSTFYLGKRMDKAIREHNMIQAGDRILVGVSGGKDSMALLRLLIERQRLAEAKFDLVSAHIRGDARGVGANVPVEFAQWIENERQAHIISDMTLPEGESLPMNCERCSRNRRKTLFELAQAHECNKIALGHHMEDFAHTALLNLFSSGRLETMAFRRDYFGGRISVIRPLAYIHECEIARFAQISEFPIIQNDCPMISQSKRGRIKEIMKPIYHEFRSAYSNIIQASGIIGEDGPSD